MLSKDDVLWILSFSFFNFWVAIANCQKGYSWHLQVSLWLIFVLSVLRDSYLTWAYRICFGTLQSSSLFKGPAYFRLSWVSTTNIPGSLAFFRMNFLGNASSALHLICSKMDILYRCEVFGYPLSIIFKFLCRTGWLREMSDYFLYFILAVCHKGSVFSKHKLAYQNISSLSCRIKLIGIEQICSWSNLYTYSLGGIVEVIKPWQEKSRTVYGQELCPVSLRFQRWLMPSFLHAS